jgi:MFS family permease
VPTEIPERSYRALAGVNGLPRVLAGMVASRIAEGMTAIALVLFTLQHYRDPALAGIVTFFSIAPGLLVSPLVGALLDRHGRTRLIVLDLAVAASAMWLLAILAIADALPAGLLVGIVAVASLTGPLSRTGLRTLFPIIVPRHLWERANAIDSNGYVLSTLVGPPAAGAIVQVAGGPAALTVIGLVYAISAVILARAPDPDIATASSGRILRDSWDGLLYVLRHRTLFPLGVAVSCFTIAGGIIVIAVPLLVLERLGASEVTVGLVFAVQGLAGLVAALLTGRVDTLGRERLILAGSVALIGAATGLLTVPAIGVIFLSMAIQGFFNGPFDVALFTIRQRRTDPAWMGRAFAISMSLNFLGYPIGSLIGGALGTANLDLAIWIAVAMTGLSAVLVRLLIPRTGPEDSASPAG